VVICSNKGIFHKEDLKACETGGRNYFTFTFFGNPTFLDFLSDIFASKNYFLHYCWLVLDLIHFYMVGLVEIFFTSVFI